MRHIARKSRWPANRPSAAALQIAKDSLAKPAIASSAWRTFASEDTVYYLEESRNSLLIHPILTRSRPTPQH